ALLQGLGGLDTLYAEPEKIAGLTFRGAKTMAAKLAQNKDVAYLSYKLDQGVGVRAISGEKTGFAYADQISLLALEQSAQAARTIVRDNG
ncbi:hypothetical protein MJM45_27345, partial [Salmonella enterica subsp. enterica serovar Kentucky]|nr:hypothetical protein [Salmonella enterica subsp. enterica serovar Kentucky]